MNNLPRKHRPILHLALFILALLSYLLTNANRSGEVWNHLGVITETSVLRPTNPSAETFMSGRAFDGNTIVMHGSKTNPILFTKQNGEWKESFTLPTPKIDGFVSFNTAAAIDGDLVAVTADFDEGVTTFRNAVLVYERKMENEWEHVTTLHGSEQPEDNATFGLYISLSGNTVAIAEQDFSIFYDVVGKVYLFERHSGGTDNWGEVAILRGSDFSIHDDFGLSIDLHGDTLVVGAFHDEHDDNDIFSAYGSAHVFERNQGGADNWGITTELRASDAQRHDWFGFRVSVYEDTIIVSALRADNTGVVYLFERDDFEWNEASILRASNWPTMDNFGGTIAINKDRIIVNANERGILDNGGEAVYLFERDNQGMWRERAILQASDSVVFPCFYGREVSDTLIVGSLSCKDGDEGESFVGAVYLYELPYGVTARFYLPLLTD